MEPTVIEVDDSLALSSDGSPSLSPMRGTRRYQCRPLVLIIGMLIAGGICVIVLLPTKSLQSADEIYCNQQFQNQCQHKFRFQPATEADS